MTPTQSSSAMVCTHCGTSGTRLTQEGHRQVCLYAEVVPVGTPTLECTHCNGEGLCWDGADPLWDCPDEPHRCHSCGGSGNRSDQRVF